MSPLPNPELEWDPPAARASVTREEIEARIGHSPEPFEPLAGGLANTNVRLGSDRVLRIHRRDPASTAREVTLLQSPWRSFRVPRVFASGDDFVLMEHVPHRPLHGTAGAGARVGRALAEIHRIRPGPPGLLGASLAVEEPWSDVIAVFIDYLRQVSERGSAVHGTVLRAFEAHAGALRELSDPACLLHADFKVSNLHETTAGELLVLDWEFAYSGPSLLDVGQLFRWSSPDAFERGFEDSYREAGGRLPSGWQRWAALFDLINLSMLREQTPPAATRRARDIEQRIRATLAAL